MKIRCGKCNKGYYFDESRIPEGGISFTCPRCKETVLFSRETGPFGPASTPGGGRNPIVSGAFSGAVGGIGCAVPTVLLALLGIGVISMGMDIPARTTTAAILISFLEMFSLGIIIGTALAVIGAKTGMDAWSFPGWLTGTLIGMTIGFINGTAVGTMLGGVFGVAAVLSSTLIEGIKAALLTAVIILVKRQSFFSYEEGSLSAPLTKTQALITGMLFLLVFVSVGLEAKGLLLAKAMYRHNMSTEGLVLKDVEGSFTAEGDLLLKGTIENRSGAEKTGWIVVAELLDEQERVIRKATLINGLQLYSARERRILHERGRQAPRPIPARSEDRTVIRPWGSVSFEVLFVDPPKEYTEHVVSLKDLDGEGMKETLTDILRGMEVHRR